MAWAMAVLAVGGMAAAGFEIWLSMRQHPRRFQYAWAAWSPLAFLAVFAIGMEETGDPIGSGLMALVAAPFAYPLLRGLIWLRFGRGVDGWQAEEAAAEAERMRYRAMDFGGSRTVRDAPPTPPAAARETIASPVALPAASSRLDRATRERRPGWVAGAEILLICGACAVGLSLWIGSMIANLRDDRRVSDEEMVAGTLELNGYGGPRVTPTGETCADGYSAGYRWSAVGSAGRACVDGGAGEVSLWVEQRWGPAR